MPRQSSSFAPLVIACLAVAIPLAYPLSYLALATHELQPLMLRSSRQYACREPHYRFGGEQAETLFRPLERLDRWLRPAYWEMRPLPSTVSWTQALEQAKLRVQHHGPDSEFDSTP